VTEEVQIDARTGVVTPLACEEIRKARKTIT
jgi:hypothetical protein